MSNDKWNDKRKEYEELHEEHTDLFNKYLKENAVKQQTLRLWLFDNCPHTEFDIVETPFHKEAKQCKFCGKYIND